jgi:hypothetical protein
MPNQKEIAKGGISGNKTMKGFTKIMLFIVYVG